MEYSLSDPEMEKVRKTIEIGTQASKIIKEYSDKIAAEKNDALAFFRKIKSSNERVSSPLV